MCEAQVYVCVQGLILAGSLFPVGDTPLPAVA